MKTEVLLTDKVCLDFEKWYFNQWINKTYQKVCDCDKLISFNDLPFSMQFGVYVDYFDSCGIYIKIEYVIDANYCYYYPVIYTRYKNFIKEPLRTSLQEAREKVIERASEIREEQL